MLSSYFKTSYFISAVTGSVLVNLVFFQTPLLTSHIPARWSSAPSGQLQVPLNAASPRPQHHVQDTACYGHARKAHQPHCAHFQVLPLSPHKLLEVHTIQHHLSLLASIIESSPVFITVYRTLSSMVNAQLKDAILLCRSVCMTIINRTTWLDVLGSTRYRMLCSPRQ